MQLASHGMRGIPRNVPNILPGGQSTARAIHIPSFATVKPPSASGTAKRILSETRTFLTRLVGHLTAPGLQHPYASHAVRGAGPGRMASIKQRMSYPVRNALARPVQPLFFPHAPTFVNRSVVQVGLGSARKFSSSRPLFQNIIDNVPVTARALYEADWELDMKASRAMMKKPVTKGKEKTQSKQMMKPKAKTIVLDTSIPTEPESAPELDQYFASIDVPSVTTCLLIPLAPTPTNRVPLPPDTSPYPSLLPLQDLGSIHNSHELHSLRVSALFSRLDAANVWDKGVNCYSYASRSTLEGVCTILKVEFVGWTKAQVRGVIGESGTGWCVLEEVQTERNVDEDDNFSDTSSILSGISGGCDSVGTGAATPPEPSESLVLPTLDFSSTFMPSTAASPRLSPTASFPETDVFSDMEVDTDPWADGSSDGSWTDAGAADQWYGFNSDFTRRVDANSEWREPMESAF
ncbi:hypothetical protein VKT23_013221 [Stygiomarasmius scandens]|uniref:Uncharacterized protein n=1 Tax=Marasmiellus scandens TaxID=2682957 RepID=A0ABR1J6J9_9AGAR